MTLTQMNYIVTLSKCLNFSEAAQLLFISQPTLSKQVSVVEEEIGFIIFRRNSKSTDLTSAGRKFCKGLEAILDDYNRLLLSTRQQARADTHGLRIGIAEFRSLAPMVLRAFQVLKKQDVDISIVSRSMPELKQALIQGDLDIILQPGIEDMAILPDVEQFFLYTVPNYLFVPADSPALAKEHPGLADFADMDFIIVGEQISAFEENVRESYRRAGLVPKFRYVENFSDLVVMVSSGLGICTLPAEHYLASSSALYMLPISEVVSSSMYAMWKQNSANPVISQFKNLINKFR